MSNAKRIVRDPTEIRRNKSWKRVWVKTAKLYQNATLKSDSYIPKPNLLPKNLRYFTRYLVFTHTMQFFALFSHWVLGFFWLVCVKFYNAIFSSQMDVFSFAKKSNCKEILSKIQWLVQCRIPLVRGASVIYGPSYAYIQDLPIMGYLEVSYCQLAHWRAHLAGWWKHLLLL